MPASPLRPSPLVVIVTPVYNGGRYLRAAMESVQAQTYRNIVHVVLDNASTDDTAAIIASFRDAPIEVRSRRNATLLPLADNWNAAFSGLPEQAVYAKLLCADDLIRSDCIERFVALAESDPAISLVLSDDVFADDVRRANLPAGKVLAGHAVARAILDHSVQWLPYQHFFVRLEAADRAGAFFASRIAPDASVVLRSALRGRVGYVRDALVYTRWHPESQTSRYHRELNAEAWCYLLHLLEHYGPDCFDASGLRAARDLNLGRQARFVLRWLLRGRWRAARSLHRYLASMGMPLSPWQYLRYAILWPAYAAAKHRWQTPVGPHLDAQTFMRSGHA
ncbi:MAG: glycosyltransferase [Candidatus Dactylopiibacterium sp.]|nr:glycosyltransferase [Candidatus Dactylopiibacterium sp.]